MFELTRPSKRPRLSPKSDMENTFAADHPNSRSNCHHVALHKEAKGKAEKALLDDLMAGLDASAFEAYDPSPQKIMAPTNTRRSPLRIKQRVVSPTKQSQTVINTLTLSGAVKRERDVTDPKPLNSLIKRERSKSPAPLSVYGSVVIEDLKAELLDDELYEFDFDLADFSHVEEDLLLKPQQIEIKYPLLNPPVPLPPAGYQSTPWERCTINAVLPGFLFSDGKIPPLDRLDDLPGPSSSAYGKTLIVTFLSTAVQRVVHLRERWADLDAKSGDIINIISPSLQHSSPNEKSIQPILITFKDTSSYIIHHPDTMVTMTSIANAVPCPRKPLLQALVKPSGPVSKPMLYGNILHELLQGALSEQNFDIDATRRRLADSLKKEDKRLDLWGAGLGEEDVKVEVGEKAGRGFEVFGQKWVGAFPKSEGELHTTVGDSPSLLAITGLHDIEEDIWSPKWGLKGKVDASVQAQIIRDPQKRMDDVEENIAPMEIKTGRSVGVMAHRAQTMLYTLLMEDRYGVPVPAGLLYYSQLDSILRVEAKPNEIRALIIARNELAAWLSRKRKIIPANSTKLDVGDMGDSAFLPPTIDHAKECRSCYAIDSCMLYRKAVDGIVPSDEDPIAELYQEKMGHLSEKDAAFFRRWESLLTVEEQDTGRYRSQLWTMTAKERERTGRCFGDMIIDSYSNDLGKSLAKIHRHTYTFVRAPKAGTQAGNTSLLSGHIAKGDPVSLSIEPDLLCLSRGFVTDLTSSSITIGVTYVIDTDALLARTEHRKHAMSEDGNKVLFRIDKDEMTSGMMRMRTNLANLFFAGGDEKRRRLIVDLDPPQFEDARSPLPEEIPSSLNADQTKAMEQVMTARDYALILGMPGTGKTTTIAEIIKALVQRGKSVLLTSYTHSAVDTILMKLLNADFGMLRLGNIDKVHPDVQHLTLEAFEGSANMNQLEARLMSPPVVAATCLAVDHPLFFRRKFDYCIVDEASQITLPTCLGPLRLADTFVLVGDHFQLPPIVRNPEARRGGLDVSLFRLLSEAHPQAVVDLSHQYRMNEDIMLLSNHLIYENRLKCGSEEVASQGLVLPKRMGCAEMHGRVDCGGGCWVQDLLEEKVKAVFVDTDLVPALDSRIGSLVQNETEAKLVYQFAHALTSCGIKEQDIAVITPYRQQIKLLTGHFRSLPKVEILTADKSQGRDKECILISLVRSNEDGNIGDLLRDWRRINVSFTRAKKKLVIFGSRRTLQADCLLAGFLRLMESKGWVYQLPKGAEGLHESMQGAGLGLGLGLGVDVMVEKEVQVKVESGVKMERVSKGEGEKKGKVGDRILDGKPFAREVFAELA